MRRSIAILIVIVLMIAGGLGYLAGSSHLLAPSHAVAADDCQTFPQTGKTVCGDFLKYWQDHGGLAQQGYPISDVFDEKSETDGITHKVQYFERAVFEAHPENQPPNNVLLSLLGSQKYKTKYGNNAPPSSSAPVVIPVVPSPTGPPGLRVVTSGFGQNGQEIEAGFIVENTGSSALESSQYQVTAYASDETVLTTNTNYIAAILPGQRLGIGTDLFESDKTPVARLDVQVKAGTTSTKNLPPAFTTDKATLKPDKTSPHVIGIVRSSYTKDIKNIRVSAILYDGTGRIIGAGFTFADFIPANGQSAVDMSVTYTGTPAKVELYAVLSSLSDY